MRNQRQNQFLQYLAALQAAQNAPQGPQQGYGPAPQQSRQSAAPQGGIMPGRRQAPAYPQADPRFVGRNRPQLNPAARAGRAIAGQGPALSRGAQGVDPQLLQALVNRGRRGGGYF